MPDVKITHTRTIHVPEYGTWLSGSELEKLVADSGSHFFDRDTKRFFRSRLHDVRPGVDGWYFITSEKHEAWTSYGRICEPREYTVRRLSVNADGTDLRIDEYEEFQAYATLGRARTAVKHILAAGGTDQCKVCRYRLVKRGSPLPCTECTRRQLKSATAYAREVSR